MDHNNNTSFGNSSSSSDGDDDQTETTNISTITNGNEEHLGTHLQLRLSASHLPKTLGGKRFGFTRKSPDTFATVASIVRKEGGVSYHQHHRSFESSSDFRSSTGSTGGGGNGRQQNLMSSFSSLPGNAVEDFMVEWGSTEVIRNTRSPQWIETIPLKYEYGSELFFYVRVLEAERTESSKGHSSLSPTTSNSSDDQSQSSQGSTHYKSPRQKNRMGFCFGTALFEVGDILGSRNYTKVKRFKSGGCIYARLEPELMDAEQKVRFRFQFQALLHPAKRRRLGLASQPHTVLEISRPQVSPIAHSWITVFRSRPVFQSNNPCWDLSEIDLDSCCPGDDLSRIVRLSIYRLRKGRKQKLMGMCETTMHIILDSVVSATNGNGQHCGHTTISERTFFLQRSIHQIHHVGQLLVKAASLVTLSGRDLANHAVVPLSAIDPISPPSLGPPSYFAITSPPRTPTSPMMALERTQSTDSTTTTSSAQGDPFNVDLRQLSIAQWPSAAPTGVTLNDFLDSGGQLEFCVAIDFTSSNGSPLNEGTLHFHSDDFLNDYEETITSIGNAIDKYNSSGEYAVWGFGAKFGDGIVRHLFQCGPNPTVQGVDGILDAYRSVFRSGGIYMSGPTVFVKAIQAAAVRARNYKLKAAADGIQRYCVLLVVTDGIMDNYEETKEKLSVYSEVPLSVVIVGVGRTDFRPMYSLCESPPLPSKRKNTTFVELRQHQHDPRSLAQAALRELPQHLSDYLVQHGISLGKSSNSPRR